jgi:hypothetical protein
MAAKKPARRTAGQTAPDLWHYLEDAFCANGGNSPISLHLRCITSARNNAKLVDRNISQQNE